MEEELEPVPRLDLQAIANRFRDRCLPFTAERSFHETHSSLYILSEVKKSGSRQQDYKDSRSEEKFFGPIVEFRSGRSTIG